MNNQESIEKIIDILKNGAIKFHDDIDKNSKYYFIEEKKEDEIIIHFNLKYDKILEYSIVFKKLRTIAENIPNVKGYKKLDLNNNPFKKLHFTDENEIIGNIYDYIQEINFDEIACYEKFGIILRNPLKLTGIYNINIEYTTD